ncbi:hypothetical protein Tco_0403873 [Tanacetum coccineum]
MMLLVRGNTQKFSTPSTIGLCISSNARIQARLGWPIFTTEAQNAGYGGNANKNAGRNINQGDESNQIIQRVSLTEPTSGKANVQCYNCNEKAMKDKAGSNLNNEENDFMLDTSYGEDLEELIAAVMLMARLQPADDNAENVPSYDAKGYSNTIFNDPFVENNGSITEHDSTAHDEYHETQMLACNVQCEAENKKCLNDELKKQKDLLQQELETFKDWVKTFESKTIQYSTYKETCDELEPQPKMYDGDLLHSNKLVIHSPDSEETLEDAEESQKKMRHKMVQINYEKLNALYETFVPLQEFSTEQTYFSIPSTFNNGSKSKDVSSESPGPNMPKESRLLKMIDTLGDTVVGFQTRINKTFLQDTERRWMSDSQNELREIYKTDVIPMSRSLYKTLSEIKEELIEEMQEMLNIFVTMEQKVNEKSPIDILLQNEIDRLLEVSFSSEI